MLWFTMTIPNHTEFAFRFCVKQDKHPCAGLFAYCSKATPNIGLACCVLLSTSQGLNRLLWHTLQLITMRYTGRSALTIYLQSDVTAQGPLCLSLSQTHTHTPHTRCIYISADKARDGAVCNYNEHREADAAKQQQHSAAVDIFYTGERASARCR
jgi:hypothetical protein